MLVQTIEKLDLFMLFIKTNSHQARCLVFFDAQRSPVRLLEARWHNHTPEPLKCERGQKRGGYERDRANDRTIFIRKRGFRANDRIFCIRERACIGAKSIKWQNKEKKVDKPLAKSRKVIYNIIIKLKKKEHTL